MYKVSTLYLILGMAVVSLGSCVSSETQLSEPSGTELFVDEPTKRGTPRREKPNVFQAPTLNATGCSEIEYQWESETGIENEFHPGAGGFCTKIDLPLPLTSLKARCVKRSEAGEVLQAGRWVESATASTRRQFRRLCRRFK